VSAGLPDSDELLDDATLARLRDDYASTGDLHELAALIRSFLTSGARELDALAGVADARDMEALSAGAHKLKGSSRSLGAILVGAAAERLESAAKGDDERAAADALAELHAVFSRTQGELEATAEALDSRAS
jgi:HPt (histidine-containing phosphotransfer) domain-containing protein